MIDQNYTDLFNECVVKIIWTQGKKLKWRNQWRTWYLIGSIVVGLVSLHTNLPLRKYSLKATVTLSETHLPTYS